MNRFLPLRPGLFLVAALALGLAGCGQGIGPGLTPPSTDPPTSDTTTSDGIEQTLEELPAEPPPPAPTEEPTEEPPGEPTVELTVDPPAPTPGVVTLLPPMIVPSPEDCISYDPTNLTVTAAGDAWVLRDGDSAMKLLDTAADAEDARRVAYNWRQMCFIGRDNTGPDRNRHLINYFKEPSRLVFGPAPATIDCITYDPADLEIHEGPAPPAEPDHPYWTLYAGPTPLLELHHQSDALRAQIVASGNTRFCIIGAGNDRPDPYRYQMEWWRP